MKLAERIARLDPKNDEHWTDDGLPSLTQFDKGTTREAVTRIAPELTRTSSHTHMVETAPKTDTEPEIDQLAAAIDARDEAVQAATDAGLARDRADQALKDAHAVAAEAQRIVEVHTPVEHNQTAIQRYLENQNRMRAARSQRTLAVRKAGITVADLTGKAPLDLAMSRKNTRGTQRPARHVS